MVPRPEIFISAGAELGEYRKAIKRALLDIGARPVEHQDFTVEYGPLQGVLNQAIGRCEAVIHVVGPRYGIEPAERTLGAPRRSFAHYESDVAQALGKPIYFFILAHGAPTDPFPPEDEARREMQWQHRAAIERGAKGVQTVSSPDDLARHIRALRQRLLVRRSLAHLPRRVPPERFTGRTRLMETLRAELQPGCAVVLHPPEALAESGGCGTTAVALEFAWREHEAGRLPFVFYIPAAPRTEMEAAFAALSRTPALALLPDEVAGHRARLHAVREWFENEDHAGRWLVIFDGVDNEALARTTLTFLPILQRGAVLLTSQLPAWHGVAAHPASPLSPDQTREYLTARLHPPPHTLSHAERGSIDRFGEALGRVPLALELGASLLRESGKTAAEFLTGMPPRIGIAALVERMAALLDPTERGLFRQMLCFAPQPAAIPLGLWERRGDWTQVRAALSALERRGLVVAEGERAVSIHRAVRQAARERLSPEELATALSAARSSIDAALPHTGSASGALLREALVPHCRALLGQLNGHPLEAHASHLALAIAHWLKDCGRPADAESFYRRALLIAEKGHGPAHPETAARLRDLAGALRALGRTREAVPLAQRAFTIVEKASGPDHPDTATALEVLASCLRAANRLRDAEPLYRRALALEQSFHGATHPKVAIALHHLAGVVEADRRLYEAEALYRRALSIDEDAFGTEHPRVAVRLYHLAGILAATRRLEEAEAHYRRALAIDEAKLGPEHPDLALPLRNHADVLERLGLSSEAEECYRRVLAIDEVAFGPEHPEVAVDLNNLAAVLHESGRVAEAAELYRRALTILSAQTRRFRGVHPHLRSVQQNHAEALRALGRSEEEIEAELRTLLPAVAPSRTLPLLKATHSRPAA